jgi:hypothetical protein
VRGADARADAVGVGARERVADGTNEGLADGASVGDGDIEGVEDDDTVAVAPASATDAVGEFVPNVAPVPLRVLVPLASDAALQLLGRLLEELVGSGKLEQYLVFITRDVDDDLDPNGSCSCDYNVAPLRRVARHLLQMLKGRIDGYIQQSFALHFGSDLLNVSIVLIFRKDEDEVKIWLPGGRGCRRCMLFLESGIF